MVDKDKHEGGPPLPPKLDLRKSGVFKPQDAVPSKASPTKKPEAVQGPPAKQVAPESMAPKAKPTVAVPANTPTADPKSTTAPIVIPKPKGGAKPLVRPSSAGMKTTRPSSAKPPALAKPVTPKVEAATPESASGPQPVSKPEAPAAVRPKPAVVVPPKKEATTTPSAVTKPKLVGSIESTEPPSSLLISSPSEPAQIPAVPKPKTARIEDNQKTSRISLEAAQGKEKEAVAKEPTAKTIRIKRPVGPGGPKAVQAKPVNLRAPATADATAKAGDSVEPGQAASPKRKKTVVVKRSSSGEAKKVAPAGVDRPIPAGTSEPGGVSGIMAIAALLVVSALIYMFAAQVIGPDKSQISYATGAPTLAFPGKIQDN